MVWVLKVEGWGWGLEVGYCWLLLGGFILFFWDDFFLNLRNLRELR